MDNFFDSFLQVGVEAALPFSFQEGNHLAAQLPDSLLNVFNYFPVGVVEERDKRF